MPTRVQIDTFLRILMKGVLNLKEGIKLERSLSNFLKRNPQINVDPPDEGVLGLLEEPRMAPAISIAIEIRCITIETLLFAPTNSLFTNMRWCKDFIQFADEELSQGNELTECSYKLFKKLLASRKVPILNSQLNAICEKAEKLTATRKRASTRQVSSVGANSNKRTVTSTNASMDETAGTSRKPESFRSSAGSKAPESAQDLKDLEELEKLMAKTFELGKYAKKEETWSTALSRFSTAQSAL